MSETVFFGNHKFSSNGDITFDEYSNLNTYYKKIFRDKNVSQESKSFCGKQHFTIKAVFYGETDSNGVQKLTNN